MEVILSKMSPLTIALVVVAIVVSFVITCAVFICDVRATIRDLKDWRNKPDLVIGLFVILLMLLVLYCAPLREKLFSANRNSPHLNSTAEE